MRSTFDDLRNIFVINNDGTEGSHKVTSDCRSKQNEHPSIAQRIRIKCLTRENRSDPNSADINLRTFHLFGV